MEEQVRRLDELFEALKKRWLMIVTVTLIATIISAALSFFVIKPKYEATTKVFIGKDEGDNQAYNQNDVLMYQKLMKTYSEAIKTKDLVSRSLQGTSLELKPEDVLANLTVSPVTDTQILQIKYKSNKMNVGLKSKCNSFVILSANLIVTKSGFCPFHRTVLRK